jgi:hypothetical protein
VSSVREQILKALATKLALFRTHQCFVRQNAVAREEGTAFSCSLKTSR